MFKLSEKETNNTLSRRESQSWFAAFSLGSPRTDGPTGRQRIEHRPFRERELYAGDRLLLEKFALGTNGPPACSYPEDAKP